MWKSAQGVPSHTASTILLSCNRTRLKRCTGLRLGFGLGQMKSVPRRFAIFAKGTSLIIMTLARKPTGSHMLLVSCPGTPCLIFSEIICEECGFTGTRQPTFFTRSKFRVLDYASLMLVLIPICREVSRILSFPAPRLNDLVRIDMKDYALCYQFPSSPTGFQNVGVYPGLF